MLRRGYHQETQAPGKAKGGQEEDEAGRPGGDPPGGLLRHPAGGEIRVDINSAGMRIRQLFQYGRGYLAPMDFCSLLFQI
jgi:hypothetical protein